MGNCCCKANPADEPLITTPQGDLPHAPIGQEGKQSKRERTSVAEDGRDSAEPKGLTIYTTQQSDERASPAAIMAQQFPSVPRELGDSTGQKNEKGAVDEHREPNGVTEHIVGEEDSGVGHVGDSAKPTPSSPTFPTPGVEKGSPVPENQPHPAETARKQSETDAASVVSVRDCCRV